MDLVLVVGWWWFFVCVCMCIYIFMYVYIKKPTTKTFLSLEERKSGVLCECRNHWGIGFCQEHVNQIELITVKDLFC